MGKRTDDKKTPILSSVKSVAVVGGGVSGLAAAYKLKSQGVSVTLFEADERAGGKLKSVSRDGLIWDEGANTMTEREAEVTNLLDILGIREKRQFLQILLEPLRWRPPENKSNSRVSDKNLTERFGSIILGAICSKFSQRKDNNKERKISSAERKKRRGSFSFYGGMQTLTDSLCNELGDNLKLNSKVLSLSYNHDGNMLLDNWSVSYATNRKEYSPKSSFDAVIMTAPLCNVKEMKIKKMGLPFDLGFLPEVNYVPLSVIITTFKKENVKKPLAGFGVLVPSKEQQNGLKTLGTLFSSMMFPERAPSDVYLYTTFVGGSRDRSLAKASVDELKHVVTSDLRKLIGAEGEPALFNCFYWSKAFPLYGRNYNSVLEATKEMEGSLPGFFYAGNHRSGLSVGKAIASGCKAADLVMSYLNSSEICSDLVDKMLTNWAACLDGPCR
ncbi:hypothetical protein Sjap_016453 [Stephania japonica]|uniref:Amine oxidase domain-containing protein n=1 Tax=Stephania japonica TaxID=461633 RepID=A0AAP0NV01_9MAGN